MTTGRLGIALCMCLAAWSVQGETRTWTGGGADANWSTPANWGGTAPTANDTLVFSGTTQLASHNDLADDTPIAGVVFTADAGAFTLSGTPIALDGPVSNLSASAQTIGLGMALTGTRVFDASNGAITVSGTLSGAGGLTKTGAQALTLAASNSYDGVTTVNNGILLVTHGNALGSTNGNTVVNAPSGGYLQLSGGITVPEPLYLNWQRPDDKGNATALDSLLNLSGTNTLTGAVTCFKTRIYLSGGTKLIFTGGLTNLDGYLIFSIPATSSVELSGLPVKSPNNLLHLLDNGLLVANTPDNVWSRIEVRSSMTFRTDLKNTLPADSQVYLHLNTSTLNLNGYDQTVAGIYNNCYGVIRSDTPATLTVNQAGNSLHRGQLNGAVSLFKDGAGTLILSNTTSTTTGDITVTNGTLVAALTKSIGNSTNITVSGGTLDLRAPAMIPDAARLSISGDGTVAIGDGIVETVSDFFVNGVQQKSGTWGSTASGADHIDDTHFSGNGVLFVQHSPPFSATEATWDGEGEDTFLSTAANWQGDAAPLFDGSTHALFGTGGATATVDIAANLYGITFNRAGAFTFEAGSGSLSVGGGGISAASPDTTSRTYTINADVTLTDNAAWHVATNETGKTSLSITGAIGDGSDTYGFTKTGAGTLLLSGANTYDGITTVDNGMLHISHGNALGSSRNNTV
ncbi:MAG: autotransporter-associated beta strand repeat-containing protein, partial [Kiritimatiellae bacterium]|nr:autotransporter-associated beta strand repeat-containing protein [Kiritimatiellia bacterium]